MRVPLVDGEPGSGLLRQMVPAECCNGISSALPISDWVFVDPDLSVHLDGLPEGFGLATSRLYDRAGHVATGA